MADFALQTRAVVAADVREMARTMRPNDVVEARALGFAGSLEALEESVKNSTVCWTVETESEELCALFGMVLAGAKHGIPWMLSTPLLARHPLTLLKVTRHVVDEWSSAVSLYNWVHYLNTEWLDFIRVLGFSVEEEPRPIAGNGATDEPFYLFWKGEKPCVS